MNSTKWISGLVLLSFFQLAQAQNFEDSTLEDEFNEVQIEDSTSEMPLEAPYISSEEESQKAELVPYQNENSLEAPKVSSQVKTEPLPTSKRVVRKKSQTENIVNHPLAEKGLIRIKKDGSYIYKTETGQKSRSFTFRMGSQEAPRIVAADQVTDFQDIYGSETVVSLGIDYEFQMTNRFGKWGLVIGSGFFTASGNGRFLNGDLAKESYTFLAVPLTVGGIYRFEFSDHQWFVPFVNVGGAYYGLAEFRDDGRGPSLTGTPAAYGGAGLLLSVTNWDRETAFTLWSEYGIANMWVNLDYRRAQSFSEDVDVSSNSLNLGLTFDF